ncbi:hypothetical protein EGR_00007 [Echinococcus granulosus]|uniref:Uncharacterized protein n=1 Tax=Echinococcus granulosus TaxID=6210 RepID=W6UTW8_ECHGR|nr:hypothetical protein EGR_00007 [Echinococcus granulosus]EUB64738.1 hypothetical protein EGR_00007 [Echinococcus granulosus]
MRGVASPSAPHGILDSPMAVSLMLPRMLQPRGTCKAVPLKILKAKSGVGTSAPNVASYFKEPGTADAYLIGQTVEVNSDSLCSGCVAYDTGQTQQSYLV